MSILQKLFQKTGWRIGFVIWKHGYVVGSFEVKLRSEDLPNPEDFQDKMNKFLDDYFGGDGTYLKFNK